METVAHDMQSLFQQLGLDSDERSIRAFIEEHSLPPDIHLHQAEFWTPAQAQFLKESIIQDSDWAVVVDNLAMSLKK